MRSGLNWCAVKLAEWYLPTCLNFADLTLATSPQLKDQLKELGCRNVEVWRKGIDTEVFSSKFNESNIEMRSIMTDGQPTRPLLLYVGRLGREKNINMIKDVLQRIPQARLAVVGAGPAEEELKEHFQGTDTVFMGLMSGEALSRAYAAADVFVMPSESETLGFVVLEAMASEVPPVGAAALVVGSVVVGSLAGWALQGPGLSSGSTRFVDCLGDVAVISGVAAMAVGAFLAVAVAARGALRLLRQGHVPQRRCLPLQPRRGPAVAAVASRRRHGVPALRRRAGLAGVERAVAAPRERRAHVPVLRVGQLPRGRRVQVQPRPARGDGDGAGPQRGDDPAAAAAGLRGAVHVRAGRGAVSYTHLTLPTKA